MESQGSLVRFPPETCIFILKFLLVTVPYSSMEPLQMKSSMPIHSVVIVVLDHRYDKSYKACVYLFNRSIALSSEICHETHEGVFGKLFMVDLGILLKTMTVRTMSFWRTIIYTETLHRAAITLTRALDTIFALGLLLKPSGLMKIVQK